MKPEKPSLKQRWKAICDDMLDCVLIPFFCLFAMVASMLVIAILVEIVCNHLN